MDKAIKFNFFLWVSIPLAFFVHIIIFTCFTFSFPIKFQSHQPYLISLGSIIPREEFLKSRMERNTLQPQEQLNAALYQKSYQKDFSSLMQVYKPLDRKANSSLNKTTLKSTFQVQQEKDKNKIKTNPEIENTPELYQPLTLP